MSVANEDGDLLGNAQVPNPGWRRRSRKGIRRRIGGSVDVGEEDGVVHDKVLDVDAGDLVLDVRADGKDEVLDEVLANAQDLDIGIDAELELEQMDSG